MLKICLITPNLLPVPAVKGGAIEGLVTNLIIEQEKHNKILLTIVSIYNKEAYLESKKYHNTDFIYIKKNLLYKLRGLWYKIINKICKTNYNTYNHFALEKIKHKQFDFVIAEGGHYESYYTFLKYFSRDQLLLHLHHQGKANEKIEKAFSRIIGVSNFVTKDFLKTTSKMHGEALINAIDISKFNKKVSSQELKKLKTKYHFEDSDFIILYCGRLVANKGVLELINAVKQLNKSDIKLLILGSTSFKNSKGDSYTKKLLDATKGYEKNIIFTGYINNWEIYKYYALANISCLPSIYEDAAPLSTIEAMISHSVVLATRSGGIPEYLDPASSLIVEKDANIINNLCNGINQLYNNKEKLKIMGDKAYLHALKFNSSNYYNDFVILLKKYKSEVKNEK